MCTVEWPVKTIILKPGLDHTYDLADHNVMPYVCFNKRIGLHNREMNVIRSKSKLNLVIYITSIKW